MTIQQLPIYTGEIPALGQEQSEFNTNVSDKLAYDAQLIPAQNIYATEANALASDVESSAADAASSAVAAASNSNFKGNWSDATGTSNIPASYRHNGKNWQQLQNIADITTQEPSENSFWTELSNVTESFVQNTASRKNELINSNFLTPSPDAITHPNPTPESYVAGTQIFSGVYAGSGGCTITIIDGRVNCTAGDYQFKVSNTNGLDRVPTFTSSVSDYDGIPKTAGVSHALVGNEYVVTVTPTAGNVFSVKFEQGSVATGHEVQSAKGQYYSFGSVAEAVTNCPTIGSRVAVDDYYGDSSPSNSGVLFFKVVAVGAGSNDGGKYIDVDATRQLEQNLKTPFCPKAWGAAGDGLADDIEKIEKALSYAKSVGGGTVKLRNASGGYRISRGLRIPSYVTIEGIAASRYPFQNESDASGLIADFSDPNQWVIEPETMLSGAYVAHDKILTNADFNNATLTYNCCAKNLQINVRAGSSVPFGAVRMHGCPGSVVENVSAVGTGAGLLVNYCFGGNYSFHGRTLYYGTVIWGNANANDFEIYATQSPFLNTVPAEYVMPFMNGLNGSFVASRLTTEDHYNRSFGVIVGGTSTDQSAGNHIKHTIEGFGGSVFQYYSYSNTFDKFYMESAVNETNFGLVAAYSLFTTGNFHCFLSGTGVFFDLGINVVSDMNIVGLRSASGYGSGPWLDSSSSVTFAGVRSTDFGPSTPQWNIAYTAYDQSWANSTLINGWANVGGGNQIARYRINQRTGNVELSGLINSGVSGTIAFNLPKGYRPLLNVGFAVQGGNINVTSGGDVICTFTSGSTSIWLDGAILQALL